MPFPYDDDRVFMEECEKEGILVTVKKEVDWNLEVGAIARRLAELGVGRAVNEGGMPAVLFEKIKGFPKGVRMAAQMLGGMDRIAKLFGYKGKDLKKAKSDLQQMIRDGLNNPIKPIRVDSKNAPCKQNKMIGDEVNLYKFPAPMLHDGDGGRYMVTRAITITKDPDSDWVNWGTYRAMLIDKKTMSGLIVPGQHIGKIYRKYEERNEPMPFATAIGIDSMTFLAGATGVPYGVSEADVVGGMRKKPLPVVKCETNDLEVPAYSEIVIEGIVPPLVRAWEGPYGEYTGYRASPRDRRPVYMVKAITYRNDPILPFVCTGVPVDETLGNAIINSAMAAEVLERAGIPARVWEQADSGACMFVIAVKKSTPNIATMIKNTLTSQMGLVTNYTFKLLIVNDDVDIFDSNKVLWALGTRVHPRRGIIVSDEVCGPLTPYASLEERLKMNAPHVTFDATWPLDWHPSIAVPPVASFESIYPQEIQDKVLKNWKEYGL